MAITLAEQLHLMGITDSSGNLLASTNGALNVFISGGGAIIVGAPDKTAFVYGTSLQETIGGVYQDTAPGLSAGQSGAVRLTANRAFHVNLRSAAGAELLGQGLMAASIPVVLASDQTVIPVSQSGAWAVTVSGTVTANIGTTGGLALDTSVNGLLIAQAAAIGGKTGPLIQGSVTTAAPSYTDAQVSPLSLTPAGALRVDASASTQPISGTVTANIGTTGGLALDTSVNGLLIAQAASITSKVGPLIQGSVTTAAPSYTTAQVSPLSLTTAGALRVDASATTQPISGTVTVNPLTNASVVKAQLQDNAGTAVVLVNSALPTQETRSATATLSNVASSATNVTLLASNANRLGATFFNDSTQLVYLKFGATASSTSYTVQLTANAYYELPTPHLYTGIIDGIWASANGNMRVMELT